MNQQRRESVKPTSKRDLKKNKAAVKWRNDGRNIRSKKEEGERITEQ